MELVSIPRDGGGHPLLDRGTELGTKRYTGITTGGLLITLACDCKEVLIICDQGANEWSIAGTVDGATDACTIPDNSLVLPIVADTDIKPFTIAGVNGNIDISILHLR
jgi:hypothetical protein